jgi:isopenicillin N synthase-like dioxygenase
MPGVDPHSLVVVSLRDLADPSFNFEHAIHAAFGPEGLGIIAIRGIPDWESLVSSAVPLSHKLQALPSETLSSLEDPASLYSAGWSFGKEKFGDKVDTKKASFYFNPLCDDPSPPTRQQFPHFMPANLWPRLELPDLEHQCKRLGCVMNEVTILLAQRIDALEYGVKIADEMRSSLMSMARMLYYFPISQAEASDCGAKADGWIGWHNDSGFLTALTPDFYFQHSTGQIVPNPEPETAGLWIAARNGELHRISVPRDCMAIQCGESVQVVTGGKLVATPHCVRPPVKTAGVSRCSMPVFVGVGATFPLTSPGPREQVFHHSVKQWVPPLADRWTGQQNYAEFLGDSFRAYYGPSAAGKA